MAQKRSSPDHYTLRAKKEGYPARSVYKLEEMQKKFSLIQKGDSVLDIGAAPGSWTLYISRKLLGPSGRITSVDLKPLDISPLPKQVTAFQGDAFSQEIMKSTTERAPYQVVISDAAPSTTGNRTVDTARSEELVQQIISMAASVLAPGGNLVIKLFQGGGERELLKQVSLMFSRSRMYKPKACRDDSFEVFLIGLDKKEAEL